ncbi:TetR family transcriptional regulator [Ottowia testudinis]|uniref:TetR family transcriptional regulator n=1 Tax=Ottowia testudinis TaxID=2816950 RepID=A0A975H2T7_9BURK|nr:TetR family transcriptional regulator [Ottowia testudinis]QTD45198.1 TetR family transcriptional regulator [Ottowia testudinis]
MARRTKQDAQATREALLDAAERVFEQRGVSRTSLNHIAEAAGLTRGAVYWHFKDKADLFNAMMERVTLPLETELEGLAQCAGDPVDALVLRIARSLAQIAGDARTQRVLNIATVMVELVEDLGPVRERHVQVDNANVERVTHAFERASALRGQPLPAPARQLADGFHAMVRGLVYGWLLQRGFDLEATARVAMAAYLCGIGLPAQCMPDAEAFQVMCGGVGEVGG